MSSSVATKRPPGASTNGRPSSARGRGKPARPPSGRTPKYVYFFAAGKADGSAQMKGLLGGKGANLAEMTRIGLPVPPGFTVTTEVCTAFYENNKRCPKALLPQVRQAVARLEQVTGKKFGDRQNPLLVSVRSGARESMPGMMDTILNLGLNDQTVEVLARRTGNPRFAWDSCRRFIQMYGDVVMGVQARGRDEHEPFEEVMAALKKETGVTQDTDLTADHLRELVTRYKKLIRRQTGRDFPQEPLDQMWGAVGAVFGSWNNDRAIVYRRKYHIPHEWGTAVNVQAMVFGNLGDTSATGVAFTRDPATGKKAFYGEYLINAQGEDVVAGIRTPHPIALLAKEMPKAHAELEKVRRSLEKHFKDMQDFEFTVEDGTLYMLQTRSGKRTGLAAVRIAVEMVEEKLIGWKTAVKRVPADSLAQVLAPVFDRKDRDEAVKNGRLLCKGLPAGPGAAGGKVVFNAEDAVAQAHKGERVLLVRVETTPEDLRGMIAAEGILTARGGVSSHAALVARQMGKVCVCGAQDLHVEYGARRMKVKGHTIKEGDSISIDGSSGEVFLGEVKTAPSEVVQVLVEKTLDASKSLTFRQFAALMKWADKLRKLGIRTNADQPDQAANAIAFGAEGIGLCRTEHMFFGGSRIDAVREMILAETVQERRKALAKLLPYQRQDFAGIFREMKGLPVTIRTLDPPLHEFLPNDAPVLEDLAKKLDRPIDKVKARVGQLHEANPMLGHRGCRLGISYPEITEMQARAIFEAAAEVQKQGVKVRPEIMIPLVGFPKELTLQLEIVHRVAREVQEKTKQKIHYLVGTMIEIPRAALAAGEIAREAEFFSFGTNDLTQTTLGMSRDDSGSFLPNYMEQEIMKANPFASIERAGIGKLMKIAVEGGRSARKDLKIGICGEHGGDPSSVEFCHELGLSYVSCSPFRVPVARLAAAQAVLKQEAAKS
ncbi:MAG: pyruvate, phosphate dikinase [Candidatus Omnitrophica bacterium]|nr:pyruvate, phosphate dikinase [Candidatus Omnitrophota bacterium]